jgi:hypothetical protein
MPGWPLPGRLAEETSTKQAAGGGGGCGTFVVYQSPSPPDAATQSAVEAHETAENWDVPLTPIGVDQVVPPSVVFVVMYTTPPVVVFPYPTATQSLVDEHDTWVRLTVPENVTADAVDHVTPPSVV